MRGWYGSGPPLPPELSLPVDRPAGFRSEVHGEDLSEVLWLGRNHQDSSDSVREVVVTAGAMVDRIAPAPRGPPLEAAELAHESGVIEEFDPSGVERWEERCITRGGRADSIAAASCGPARPVIDPSQFSLGSAVVTDPGTQ